MLRNLPAYALRLVVGLLLMFAAGGVKSPGLDVVVDQLDVFGPWQWLRLLTGSATAGWSRGHVASTTYDLNEPVVRQSEPVAANDNTRADKLAHAS
jgi:hypothetical protein